MILGTSKIWSKSGPGALQKIQENMEASWKNIIYVNMGLKTFRLFRENVCPRYNLFCMVVVFFDLLWKFDYIF